MFDEDQQEIVWMELKSSNVNKLYIAVYYGKQEKESREEVETEFSNICSQIEYFKRKGEVIILGDFNAKILIDNHKILQNQSPNGKILQDMIDFNKLHIASLNTSTGIWTRVNRQNPQERSVIDYILVTEGLSNKIAHTIVDEEGTYRIKGRRESDHNTMIIRLNINVKKQTRKIKRYKMNNEEGWKQYNTTLKNRLSKLDELNPTTLTNTIRKTLIDTVGEVTVTIGRKTKEKDSQQVKEKRQIRKGKKKEYEEAIKTGRGREEKLEEYVKAQVDLRKEIEIQNERNAKNEIIKMREKFSLKGNAFWKFKAEIEGKNQKEEYDPVDENGKTFHDPNLAKEHIAQYFEQLYKARDSDPGYLQQTKEIEEHVKTIEERMETTQEIQDLTQKEMKEAIGKLKRRKAMGPDQIPNEALIETDEETRDLMRKALNATNKETQMPEMWQIGELHRLYKGKGTKGMCSNERGITVSSNVGKLYERMINERVKRKVTMTLSQAGGREGSSTADHILVLQEIVNTAKKDKKTLYLIFLDVTKAFDKAWLDGIMKIMYDNGLDDKHWSIVKQLNENLKAVIKTKYGDTRQIGISNSIRQGGVLSVIMFGILMDQISKEIEKENLGVTIHGTDLTIGSLLWVDDVVLAETDPNRMRRMLEITNHVAKSFHLEFGKQKSKTMKIGKGTEKPKFMLGQMELEYVQNYKYLGFLQSDTNKTDDHFTAIRGRTEAAYQKTIALSTNPTLKWVEMETIWVSVETCIVPIITYAGETLELRTKKEKANVNRLLENIIKRILKMPRGTPAEALYIETGLLKPTTIINQKRINAHGRMLTSGNEWMKRITSKEREVGWIPNTIQLEKEYGIEEDDLKEKPGKRKKTIERKVKANFKLQIEKEARQEKGKSKMKFFMENKTRWEPGKISPYMKVMTREQASLIFKSRTRMLDVKANFKNKYKNKLECRLCGHIEEDQKHILEDCKEVHQDGNENTIVRRRQIFTENIEELKLTAQKIKRIMEKLEARGQGANTSLPPACYQA